MDASVPVALRDKPPWRLVLHLAWPVLLQLTLVFIVTLSDAVLAGRFVPEGESHIGAQSALTTASYLSWLLSSYTVLVTVGSTALVARLTGSGQQSEAVHVANQSLVLALLLGAPGALAGVVGTPLLLTALQLPPEAFEQAADYLAPLFVVLPLQMMMQGGISSLIGAGDTRTGMWVLATVAVVNIPFSWAFFHGWWIFPEMSFPGIGMGTAVSHATGGLLVIFTLAKGRAGLKLHRALLKPNRALLRRMLRISTPAGVDSLILMVGQLWFLSIVNRLSAAESAAHGIALRCEGISYLWGTAFGTAAMTLVGQNLGAQRTAEAEKSAWTALAWGCGVMSTLGVILYVLAPQLFELFCPYPHQRPEIEAGVPVLRLIAFAMPPLAVTIVLTQALRGAGDTRVPVLITIVGFFLIRAPLAILFTETLKMGLFGAWIAMCTDLLIRGLFFLWRFIHGKWKQIEV